MTPKKLPPLNRRVWGLVGKQHGVVTRGQLLDHGLSGDAIAHRLAAGRLHRVHRGVYAVGRPGLSQRGSWMAAVLSCGSAALLSHRSAAALWGLWTAPSGIDVVVPHSAFRRRPGIHVHRRVNLSVEHRRLLDGIPVTDIASTLVDLATCTGLDRLDRAVNDADRLDLIDPEKH